MERLLAHFNKGTESTVSGAVIGIEIETQFQDESTNLPISQETSASILGDDSDKPSFCDIKLELGRQNIELCVQPQKSFDQLWEYTQRSLAWLYRRARHFEATPVFAPAPFVGYNAALLSIAEDRDALWVEIDGRKSLEHLCRCSSVQLIVDVNPNEAISWLNLLWSQRTHKIDFEQNDLLWRKYIVESEFGYRPDRYGGPDGFEDIADYINQLAKQPVVMHQGKVCNLPPESVPDLNIDLFLRSIWWHYRLRRYGNSLAVETRPFSRRSDGDIVRKWQYISRLFNL